MVNTATYYVLFRLLLLVVPYLAAHVVAFACCIVVSFLLNCRFTFGVRPTWARLVRYPLSNLTTFVTMTVGVTVLVEVSGVDPGVAALVVAVLTVPVTFAVARLLLVGRLRAGQDRTRRPDQP